MNIEIHDYDNTNYPNLALMKLSAWHKRRGDSVEFAAVGKRYDKIYSSRVFTFTDEDFYFEGDVELGGTGHDIKKELPREVEFICPDYSLYDCKRSYGFLTRGCANNCSWCFVPEKEGKIQPHADIMEFARHKEVVLMDNNVLASDHGIHQIEKISELGFKVDFNQGLDARLIDSSVAKLLGKVKWFPSIRLACDSISQIEPIRKAVELLRWHNVTPSQYFCYVLVKDVEDALERVKFLKGIYVYPFAQPYLDKDGTKPTKEQRDFARWVNHRAVFRSIIWEEYNKRK